MKIEGLTIAQSTFCKLGEGGVCLKDDLKDPVKECIEDAASFSESLPVIVKFLKNVHMMWLLGQSK